MRKKLISLFIILVILATVFVTTTAANNSDYVTFYKIVDWANLDMGTDLYADNGYISDAAYGDPDIFGPDRFDNDFGGDGSSYFVMQNTSYVGAYGWTGPQLGLLHGNAFQYAKPAHTKNMSDFDGVAFKIYFDDDCDPLDEVYGNPMRRVNIRIDDKDGKYSWVSDTARVLTTKNVVDLSINFNCFSKVVTITGHPEDPDNLEYLKDPSVLSNVIHIQISGWSAEAYKGGTVYINDIYGYKGDFNPYKKGDINGDGCVNEADYWLFFEYYENMVSSESGFQLHEWPNKYPWGESMLFGYNMLKSADINCDGVVDEKDMELLLYILDGGTITITTVITSAATTTETTTDTTTTEATTDVITDTETPTAKLVMKGDINGDGKVNGMDLLLMKQNILGVSGKAFEESIYDFKIADMNEDGKINGMDLLLLKKAILS